MAKIIKGSLVTEKIQEDIRSLIASNEINPCLGVVRIGEKDSDLAYERGLRKTCEKVGIELKVFSFPENIKQNDIEEEFVKINEDPDIHGILLFKPLPGHLDEKRFSELISPEKDIDCISPVNWARLSMGDNCGFVPCTAEAVVRIIEHESFPIASSNAVIIGRSNVIGKPLGLMLLSRNATVTWCHSKTKDIAEKCRNADILVSACGVAGLVDSNICSHVNPDCIAIDVGMNFVDGKMCGDFDFDNIQDSVGSITPVPGGVGAVTNTVLAEHVVLAAVKSKNVLP